MAGARPFRLRPVLRAWHRWFGLLAGVWLLLLAITGCAITLYDELDTLLNPDWRRVPASAAPSAAIDTVIARTKAALPALAPTTIQLADAPGDVHRTIARGSDGAVQVFSDPRDGAVLGWRSMASPALDRRHLMDVFYGLHTDLLLGPLMTSFLGLVALAWMIDHFISLALSLPRRERWRDAFALAGKRGSLRRLFDWHRAKGMWAWPATFVLALTGLTLAWPEATRDAVRPISSVGDRLHESWPDRDPGPAPIGIDAAIARVTGDRARVHSVRLLPAKGVYAVRTFDPRDLDDQGRLWTYVAMRDGAIVAHRHDNGASAGDQFFAWQYPLHSGKAFGAAGRTIVFLAGVAVTALGWTGISLWLRRRRQPSKPGR